MLWGKLKLELGWPWPLQAAGGDCLGQPHSFRDTCWRAVSAGARCFSYQRGPSVGAAAVCRPGVLQLCAGQVCFILDIAAERSATALRHWHYQTCVRAYAYTCPPCVDMRTCTIGPMRMCGQAAGPMHTCNIKLARPYKHRAIIGRSAAVDTSSDLQVRHQLCKTHAGNKHMSKAFSVRLSLHLKS